MSIENENNFDIREKENAQTVKPNIQCLNCGTIFNGNYCPNCGQPSREAIKISFGRFIQESVLDFFMWDSRLFKTLRVFFRQPGLLTVEYNLGKRIGYLPPFRFFLFSTLVFFILNGLINGSKDESEAGKSKFREFEMGFKQGGNLDSLLSDRTIENEGENEGEDEWQIGLNNGLKQSKVWSKMDSVKRSNKSSPEVKEAASDSGKSWIERRVKKNLKALQDRPNGMSELILRRFTHMLFLLMPLFALILRVLFRKSKMAYTEHLIFSLHVHTNIFLVFLLNLILSEFGELILIGWIESVANILYLYPPVYLFLAMKRVYKESGRKTVLKFFLLNSVYSVALIIGMMIAAFLVLIGF